LKEFDLGVDQSKDGVIRDTINSDLRWLDLDGADAEIEFDRDRPGRTWYQAKTRHPRRTTVVKGYQIRRPFG